MVVKLNPFSIENPPKLLIISMRCPILVDHKMKEAVEKEAADFHEPHKTIWTLDHSAEECVSWRDSGNIQITLTLQTVRFRDTMRSRRRFYCRPAGMVDALWAGAISISCDETWLPTFARQFESNRFDHYWSWCICFAIPKTGLRLFCISCKVRLIDRYFRQLLLVILLQCVDKSVLVGMW